MDDPVPLPGAPVPAQTVRPLAALRELARPATHRHVQPTDVPFMNSMDEISYWICTKQAPCLYNYDNVIKRQCEAAHCSKPKSVQSIVLETPSPKKKKKRKLSLLDDESVSTEKQRNVYFETSQKKNQHAMAASHKSDTLGSDIDFNIKYSSIQEKSKRARLNKSNRTIHKKNKIVTSTPKVTANLRRSLRKTQRTLNNNSKLDDSFELYDSEAVNRNNNTKYSNEIERLVVKDNKSSVLLASGDQSNEKQNCNNKPQKTPMNGQFDDLSDVSGFTANYIRSTKIHSSKRNLRNKVGRNIIKESQNTGKDDDAMVLCVNKSVNTGLPQTPILNCSTDSSQNIVNLITLKNNDKSNRVSRGTSVLKFLDSKNNCKKTGCNIEEKPIASNMNTSYQSKSSVTSRYPKRQKNIAIDTPTKSEKKSSTTDKRRRGNKNSIIHSDLKENPEEMVSRTRSGKRIARQPENSVLVLSNSVEQVSSLASMNVATPSTELRSRSRRRKCTNQQIESVRRQEPGDRRDSVRDKSGFTACFSDSDEDNAPIKDKKFFC